MLKNLIFIFVLSIVLFSCKKEDVCEQFHENTTVKFDVSHFYFSIEGGGWMFLSNEHGETLSETDLERGMLNEISAQEVCSEQMDVTKLEVEKTPDFGLGFGSSTRARFETFPAVSGDVEFGQTSSILFGYVVQDVHIIIKDLPEEAMNLYYTLENTVKDIPIGTNNDFHLILDTVKLQPNFIFLRIELSNDVHKSLVVNFQEGVETIVNFSDFDDCVYQEVTLSSEIIGNYGVYGIVDNDPSQLVILTNRNSPYGYNTNEEGIICDTPIQLSTFYPVAASNISSYLLSVNGTMCANARGVDVKYQVEQIPATINVEAKEIKASFQNNAFVVEADNNWDMLIAKWHVFDTSTGSHSVSWEMYIDPKQSATYRLPDIPNNIYSKFPFIENVELKPSGVEGIYFEEETNYQDFISNYRGHTTDIFSNAKLGKVAIRYDDVQ